MTPTLINAHSFMFVLQLKIESENIDTLTVYMQFVKL
jgi:hypothetical protein